MARPRHRYPPHASPELSTPIERRRPPAPAPAPYAPGLPGMGIDAHGGPVIDPTANVLALVEAANRRQDDLREMNNARIDAELRNQEQMADLRASHQTALDTLEAKRLDAVRSVDQLAVKTEADRSAAAIAALATAAATTAETLRSAVNTSAINLATQLDRTVTAITERIAALEKSSYTGQGKQAIADPMMEQLIAEMRNVTAQRAADRGRSDGMSDTAKAIIGGLGLLLTLSALYTFTQQRPAASPPAPQVIYVPAPAGALLPTTPPQPTPR
jgi:hypothetical protein